MFYKGDIVKYKRGQKQYKVLKSEGSKVFVSILNPDYYKKGTIFIAHYKALMKIRTPGPREITWV